MSESQESGVEGPESSQGPAAVNPNPDLFDLLRSLDLPTGDYAVFGSGPMIVRGVIEPTNDLDVVRRGAAWAAALKLGQLVDLPEHERGAPSPPTARNQKPGVHHKAMVPIVAH